MARTLVRILELKNYSAQAAHGYEQALERLNGAALVISDIIMPGQDRVELCQAMLTKPLDTDRLLTDMRTLLSDQCQDQRQDRPHHGVPQPAIADGGRQARRLIAARSHLCTSPRAI
jgi:CheY-like chemotaxis protein